MLKRCLQECKMFGLMEKKNQFNTGNTKYLRQNCEHLLEYIF